METYNEQVEKAYQSILKLDNKQDEITDLEGKKWKKAVITLDNGEQMHIATDGHIVRIMTLQHCFMEVHLEVDKMYYVDHCDIPEDFIAKDEMQI